MKAPTPPGQEAQGGVFIYAHSQYRGPLLAVGRRLKERDGLHVRLYVNTRQKEAFYRDRACPRDVSEVHRLRHLHEFLSEPPPADVVARARAMEQRLGITVNELRLSNRHLGRAFALSGTRHPRSHFSEQASFPHILNAYTRFVEQWEEEIARWRPRLVIYPDNTLEAVCRAHGIPTAYLCGARHRNHHYWSPDGRFSCQEIRDTFRNLCTNPPAEPPPETEAAKEPEETTARPYKGHMDTRVVFLRESSLKGTLSKLALALLRHLYWTVRGYDKSKGYLLRDTLMNHINVWRDTRFLTNPTNTLSVRDLEGRKFIFYPLQTDPEAALQGLSPDYFFQLETIAAIARCLPADVSLVVKETFWAVGRRPQDFYRHLAEFKNVILAHMLDLGPDVISRSLGVVTITGTAALEATTLGRPAVVMGKGLFFAEQDAIVEAQTIDQLTEAVQRMARGEFDPQHIRQQAQVMLRAIERVGFDMGSFNALAPDTVTEDAIEGAYAALKRGFF
ncbi:hypothetical protein SAMN05421742_101490 [Roseospirillum parvum]|uniref:Capsule polysaccharide biosynthesis protein n=1 Tax=Roseospirillum parvum TaxID=83401 RepID=A0A1G7UZL0_9PROT|nr:hypothetical protein SAMN05421742_101490 [Roseospirillum parvum]